jgi:hypothetical protein
MRKLITTSSAALLALGLATGAHAQQYHPFLPTTGTSEVDFSAAIDLEDNNYLASARWGYFFNRNFQLGLDAAYQRLEADRIEGGHVRAYELGLFGNFHFPTATQWLPYIGLFGGYFDAKNADSSTSWGAQGGVKYFFNQNVAGFGEVRWRDREDTDDSTNLVLGLAIFFR